MSCVGYPLLLLLPDARPLSVMHGPEGYFSLLISISATCMLCWHRCACSVVECPPGGMHTEQQLIQVKVYAFLQWAQMCRSTLALNYAELERMRSDSLGVVKGAQSIVHVNIGKKNPFCIYNVQVFCVYCVSIGKQFPETKGLLLCFQ